MSSVKVGGVYYFWSHAYLRVLGRVTAILGTRRVALEEASVIFSDDGQYEGLIGNGVGPRTNYNYVGTFSDLAYLAAIDFPHPLPGPRKDKR